MRGVPLCAVLPPGGLLGLVHQDFLTSVNIIGHLSTMLAVPKAKILDTKEIEKHKLAFH